MSTINVTNLSGRNGSPNLPDGAVVTGVVTSTTFDGNLKSTGTPTLGLGVTINASGVNVSGVLTATTLYGDGSNLTGVGETVAPWHYNPDVNDTLATVDTGIGITFNKKVLAGSGTATLKIVNAGTAGTTIQSWGVSSATYNVTAFTLDALVSDLTINQTYQIDIPEGFIVDSNETSYAGTAYTFTAEDALNKMWTWGEAGYGSLGQNDTTDLSSPKQLSSVISWKAGWGKGASGDNYGNAAIKTDGTLWIWGINQYGELGQNSTTQYSSPVQVPGTTWNTVACSNGGSCATKTDGTLWAWGYNVRGQLGQNNRTDYSSPIQIGSETTWNLTAIAYLAMAATKTDGTLWAWGINENGQLGHNDVAHRSSPVQLPGTTWSKVAIGPNSSFATKTDGTLWAWGSGANNGDLGLNNKAKYSSPTQIPGTTWALIDVGYRNAMATKTDGTLWGWGRNNHGALGVPSTGEADRSSPVQVPGTTWGTSNINHISAGFDLGMAIKTDGTLWAWGDGGDGQLAQGADKASRSSPTQVGSLTDWDQVGGFSHKGTLAIQRDETP